jgi:hypothetical protein
MRVQSYAVWSAVVFTLNVVAFLLMGMQAKSIVTQMQGPHLRHALGFAGLVALAVRRTMTLDATDGLADSLAGERLPIIFPPLPYEDENRYRHANPLGGGCIWAKVRSAISPW